MFVFRNYTIENLFSNDTRFSGYDDVSYIPTDERELVWLYFAPVNFDVESKIAQIDSWRHSLSLVVNALNTEQTLYICTLIDTFAVTLVDTNRGVETAIANFNTYVSDLAAVNSQIKLIDIADYFCQYPRLELTNWRFYFISQMIISPAVAIGFSDWFMLRKSQINGSRKKCIVLDLDNTLWGGVVGEDGIDGIKIGGDYPGNVYLYFQQALISLTQTGVIIAVCSKNNEADILEVWDKNPFVRLNKQYISAYRINWNNKADNIREIAAELNIGLDSMVFIDDNPTERELVRQQLPMVAVPEFPKKPYGLMELYALIVAKFFRTTTLTVEDLGKTEQYRANAQRKAVSKQFTDLSEYIRNLEIKINITPANSFNIPRIAQMTQKTNQFNLTTRRYSEADINSFINSGHQVICVSVSDRFGDNGITAAAIIKQSGDTAHIDSFLLSCRILGKNIETAILNTILNDYFDKGITKITAEYIQTAKNAQVADFYDRHGFTVKNETDNSKLYCVELKETRIIDSGYTIIRN